MIYYITSPTYKEVISSTIKENESLLLAGCTEAEDFLLYSFIKQNAAVLFSTVDCIVIDLSACCDVDDKIIDALEMLKMTNDEIRIVILASLRHPGDALLTKCFQMAIYNIICTDDFLEIREQLRVCLGKGKQYKDALDFKMASSEQVVVKTEVKRTVNKVMIGISGTQIRIGVTHQAIVLANFLRKKGYMVAIAECNASHAYLQIAENMDARIEEGEFTLNGVDFYADVDSDRLAVILGKSYNFILCDYGSFQECDRVQFNKSEVRLIVAGAKAWEINKVNELFEIVANKQTLEGYHYLFNFVPDLYRADIKAGMGELPHVHFLKYTENPYLSSDFSDAEDILAEYLPVRPEPEKKSILPFGLRFGGKK